MTDTVLGRPAVKIYLQALDAACVILPVAQARELHEMIAAHLDEALPPGASNAEVRAGLPRPRRGRRGAAVRAAQAG